VFLNKIKWIRIPTNHDLSK